MLNLIQELKQIEKGINKMKLVYVHSNGNEEVLTEVFSNRSMTVEEVLEITQFDMEDWSDGEDYDYNSLQVIS